jgi:hypothetical protein
LQSASSGGKLKRLEAIVVVKALDGGEYHELLMLQQFLVSFLAELLMFEIFALNHFEHIAIIFFPQINVAGVLYSLLFLEGALLDQSELYLVMHTWSSCSRLMPSISRSKLSLS